MDTHEDSEVDCLIPQNNSENDNTNYTTTTTSSIPPASGCTIPTPIGRTTFNMAFILYLFASLGVLLFSSTVWYIMWNADYLFFVWHPTFMALTIFMVTNGILVLQKTTTREEKSMGLNLHRLIQTISLLSVISGFYVIITFKNMKNKEHFASSHGVFGLITIILLIIQSVGGVTLANFPGLFGGVTKAQMIYKYHRISGYFLLFFIYLTALGGTQAEWTKQQFDHLWIWLLAIGLVFIGIIGRVKFNKLRIR
nr:5752_t:CDS:2 [Entrophospora candida]